VLKLLERQSVLPAIVLVSATERIDLEAGVVTPLHVEYLFGSAGSCIQRNRALERIRSQCDVVIFFDDDFAPASHWIENCLRVFESDASIGGASGVLLRDGAQTEEISWEEAAKLIEGAGPVGDLELSECKDLYGCNMAYRSSAIGDVRFDERLVLYGWMEDMDFSRTIGNKERLVQSASMLGVHLGIKSGRVREKRYGYSQVVNPWYLHKKGILSTGEACSKILKPFLMNGMKSIRPERYIDRQGRFGGNIIGIAHLLTGSCRPELAADL
jgi:GT2 family glycosyltransferase